MRRRKLGRDGQRVLDRRSVRSQVGAHLARHRVAHGELAHLSERAGVSVRTLGNWRDRARRIGPGRVPGRPASQPRLSRSELFALVRAWRALPAGHRGAETLLEHAERLRLELPVRWTQRLVRRLREDRARHARRRIERRRQHVEVLARNALWSSDESFLVRDEHGEVRSHVVRETVAPKTLAVAIGPPAKAADLIGLWRIAAAEHEGYPLVVAIDNSGPGRSVEVQAFLREHQIVALFNEPHVPQHNAWAECVIGDLKRTVGHAGLESDAPCEVCSASGDAQRTRDCKLVRLLAAWNEAAWTLNARTPRASLGGLTPDEVDRIAPQADDRVPRARFYADTQAALARAAEQHTRPRALRRAQREAILGQLQAHGLLNRTRGDSRTSRPSKRKGIS